MRSCRNERTVTRHGKRKWVHACIEYCLQDLFHEAVKGICIYTKDGTKFNSQFLLSSNIGDLPG